MYVMLNTISSICINSALYSSSFFFSILPEAYAFLNSMVDVMTVIPRFFFLLALVLASCCKFSMRSKNLIIIS
ncbi:photosystem ii reaction center protein k [Phtheirospermum japonicum]|uniref:Photosystem ii reaction center protein k n=1 Tax=Phtheirospermum japonicum TaxID=374723 RepID=A0A830B5J0_9LAMI|nr:photosystem ii reaction center protein k [Phtheirospermum japonicum]